MSGSVEGIWIKRRRKGPMDPVERARAVAGRGLEENAEQGGARQVTLLERRAWNAATASIGRPDLDPRVRRANLLVGGVDLTGGAGRVLAVGPVRIRIRGVTRPCPRLDDWGPGLYQALDVDGRGGVHGEVLDDGEIAVGDAVAWAVDEA